MNLADFLQHQQILVGLVGGAIAGAALFVLRRLPGVLGWWIRERVSVSLVIDSDELPYSWVNVWLARHPKARTARRLLLEEAFDHDSGHWSWEFTLGQGWHVIAHRGAILLIHRDIQDVAGVERMMGGRKRHRLTITTLGHSQAPIRGLIAEARAAALGADLVKVSFWHQGCYHEADKRPKRALDTVYLPSTQKARLVGAVTRFVAARDTYRSRGQPHRFGVLLEGPPGTGKTTLISAIAGLLGRDVFLINLNTVNGDNELIAAFNQAGPNSVVAVEDIDAFKAGKDREKVRAQQLVAPGAPQPLGQASAVTLSGLLNAIDGVAAREGRILFLTTNHAADLDPALLRPGRVDLRETIGLLDKDAAWAMFQAFRPGDPRSLFEVMVMPRMPRAAADLQAWLIDQDHVRPPPTHTAKPQRMKVVAT